jgi:guanylate kinase
LLCLDLKGARQIKRVFPKNTVTIFVVPPSLATLRNRIEGRCSKTKKKEIGQRLKLAKEELRASKQYDYSLVNSNLERAVKELKTIILQKTGD